MSVTCISSKHSKADLAASSRATRGMGSPRTFLRAASDAIVHLGHELVEVNAPLRPERGGLEEQVHQHGLAAPHRHEDAGALRRRLPLAQQSRKTGAPPPLAQTAGGSPSSSRGGDRLRGIGRDHTVIDERAILIEEGHRRFG